MATVVAIPPQQLVLDDGTATLTVVNHLAIKGAIGQTVDVIMQEMWNQRQYHATCIVWNVSPQMETLRTIGIVLPRKNVFGISMSQTFDTRCQNGHSTWRRTDY